MVGRLNAGQKRMKMLLGGTFSLQPSLSEKQFFINHQGIRSCNEIYRLTKPQPSIKPAGSPSVLHLLRDPAAARCPWCPPQPRKRQLLLRPTAPIIVSPISINQQHSSPFNTSSYPPIYTGHHVRRPQGHPVRLRRCPASCLLRLHRRRK